MTSFHKAPPEISVIIPVLHEGERIVTVIAALATVAVGVTYEVIVVDGDPQGSTIECLSALEHNGAPKHPDAVRGMIGPVGRGSQMNVGAIQAKGDILLFLHADTRLPLQALQRIRDSLTQPGIVAGAFDFEINSSRWMLKVISRVACLRSRFTRIPYGDQAIFMQRQTFTALGGYATLPIMEDVALMQTLKVSGQRIRILRDRVQVSSRRWDQEGVIYCTLRNWALILLYACGVSPLHLVKWYRPLPKSK